MSTSAVVLGMACGLWVGIAHTIRREAYRQEPELARRVEPITTLLPLIWPLYLIPRLHRAVAFAIIALFDPPNK